MKTFLLRILLCGAALLSFATDAQIYSDLHSFSLYSGFPASNYDGALPYCALALSSNVLYGTTYEGGVNGNGAVFSVHTDGTQFTNLHSFSPLSSGFFGYNNDGAQLYSTLAVSGNVLYGTAYGGGQGSAGCVFRMNTDGTDFTNIHNFPNYAGAPKAGVILSSNVLYGTTSSGGINYGSVFRIDIDGMHFTNLISFYPSSTNPAFGPTGGLVLSGNTLYGTASGSLNGGGAIFSIGIDSRGYTNLFLFQYPDGGESSASTNTTGGTPSDSLTLVGGTLYGVTPHGGTNGNGAIFAINTNGTSFTNLHTFSQTDNTTGTNSDGYNPQCVLLPIGNKLYGTAADGGPTTFGTLFSINTDGSDFTNVYTFPDIVATNYLDLDGISPVGGLIVSGNILYGTSLTGGGYDGNVYALSLSSTVTPPSLGFQVNGRNLVLTWDTNTYSLQFTSLLGTSFTNLPAATSPYTVTPTVSQEFFRLKHN